MRAPDALQCWYTSAVDALAKRGLVGAVSIEGLDWSEIDVPADLQRARQMVRRWTEPEAARTRAAT
jgi:hypothetical protein